MNEATLALLAEGSIDVLGRVAASSNQALLVRVQRDDADCLAIYKAERGERPLWDFAPGLWRREVAAYALDEALRTNLVPPTVARDDGPFGPGSLQLWVNDNGEDHYFTLREQSQLADFFIRLAAFDVVANNADRKSGHVVFDSERCWAIDNGLCFHEDDKLRTVLWDDVGEPLPTWLVENLRSFAQHGAEVLSPWLDPTEIAMTLLRAEELAAHAHLPAPDEERDWPPYPWPLV